MSLSLPRLQTARWLEVGMGLEAGWQAQHTELRLRLSTPSTQAGNTGPVGSLMGNVFSPSRGNVASTTTKPLGGSHLSYNYREILW